MSDKEREVAWLIETATGQYWCGGKCGWTHSPNLACRFARAEDAHAAREWLRIPPVDVRVTEHVWLDAARAAQSPSAEPVAACTCPPNGWGSYCKAHNSLRAMTEADFAEAHGIAAPLRDEAAGPSMAEIVYAEKQMNEAAGSTTTDGGATQGSVERATAQAQTESRPVPSTPPEPPASGGGDAP